MALLARVIVMTAMLGLDAPSPPAAPGAQLSYRGTVQAVSANALELIIGVGPALRLVRIGIEPAASAARRNAAVACGDLHAGDIVQADCGRTAADPVVERIELVWRAGR